jgi:hypothetical protein
VVVPESFCVTSVWACGAGVGVGSSGAFLQAEKATTSDASRVSEIIFFMSAPPPECGWVSFVLVLFAPRMLTGWQPIDHLFSRCHENRTIASCV